MHTRRRAARRSILLAGIPLVLARCGGNPLTNAPWWAVQPLGRLRDAFPAGRARREEVTARLGPTQGYGPGYLDADGRFFAAGDGGERPHAPLTPVTQVQYHWAESGFPGTRSGHDRALSFYFGPAATLLHLDRSDLGGRRRWINVH